MENITVKKSDVLQTLQENRGKHRQVFEEALEGYREEALRVLNDNIDRVKAGQKFAIKVVLPFPEDHTSDYDRAIKMLELEISDKIELSESDVQWYVLDDWHWKRGFLTANSAYSSTARDYLTE